jgi:hypothetical protein
LKKNNFKIKNCGSAKKQRINRDGIDQIHGIVRATLQPKYHSFGAFQAKRRRLHIAQ